MDLNADLGEHDGDGYASDLALLDVVTSASIACGAHAGSDAVMRDTARAALERGVAIGAHPGYLDRAGFGRRDMPIPQTQLADLITTQIVSLQRCCEQVGAVIRYVKPHGALYNAAGRNPEIAETIARTVCDIDQDLIILALARSSLELEAMAAGLSVAREAFIDRAYLDDGTLVPRDSEGALLHDAVTMADRALSMVRDHKVISISGAVVTLYPDSLCVHGDNVDALAAVSAVRSRLELAGYACAPFAGAITA